MRGQRGMTLVEAAVVLMISGLVVTLVMTGALRWIRREAERSAVYEIYGYVSLARVSATERSRQCRFTIDTSSRRIQVVDLNDPATSTDDVVLADVALDPMVQFGQPDGSAPVTLNLLTGSQYEATFSSTGTVVSGAGNIALRSDDTFRRVALYAGGATALQRWSGSAWVTGN